jgi:hypothetical protein
LQSIHRFLAETAAGEGQLNCRKRWCGHVLPVAPGLALQTPAPPRSTSWPPLTITPTCAASSALFERGVSGPSDSFVPLDLPPARRAVNRGQGGRGGPARTSRLGNYTLQSPSEYGARRADVTVVIFANCGYQILHDELAAVGVRDFGKTSAGCSTSRGPNPAG